jgi:hypothetical protein
MLACTQVTFRRTGSQRCLESAGTAVTAPPTCGNAPGFGPGTENDGESAVSAASAP